MQPDKISPSSSDKVIGWVFTAIGALGILYAAVAVYNLHTTRPDYTIGRMIGGFVIFSLIPLLFLSSGRYYLTGKNAERLAKKGKRTAATPPIQNVNTTAPQNTTLNSIDNEHATVSGQAIAPTTPLTGTGGVSPSQPTPVAQRQGEVKETDQNTGS